MYSVIDTSTIPPLLSDRGAANLALENLQRDNPEANWEVFKQVEEMNPNVLEYLYALAAMLLEASQVNPIETGLQVYNLDGSISHKNALTIMHEAREFIDLCEAS